MMRSYFVLIFGLSIGLALAAGCSDDGGGGGAAGTGGTPGTGGGGGAAGGAGGAGGEGGEGGTPGTETMVDTLSLGCSNSTFLGAQSILSAELSVTAPSTVAAGSEFTATLSGTAFFPESFLDTAQGLKPGTGLPAAVLVDSAYIVQVRSGATGDDVTLTVDVDAVEPGEVLTCTVPAGQICTVKDDCAGGFGDCNIPVILVDVPSSDDCSVGGVCDMLGKNDSQCLMNGFCVTGDLDVPLAATDGTFTADATGPVLFGYGDMGLSNNTFDPVTELYTIPKADPSEPIVQGLNIDAGGLVVSIECVMGVDEGEDPNDAENTLVGLTPDEDLISFPVE